jgi:hypothetical protein
MERRVFVSVNTDRFLDERQRAIKNEVLTRLRKSSFEPQIFFEAGLARSRAWSFEAINAVMRRCVGAVVLGFPRWRATTDGRIVRLVGEYLHVEGMAAIAHGLPTFVAAEEGVEDRGIVYKGAGIIVASISSSEPVANVFDSEFGERLVEWIEALKDRRDIFLGFCSKSAGVAAQIEIILTRAGATMHNWAMDFGLGGSILAQIQAARDLCMAGVFVFSEDDPLEGGSGQAAPRDNVVFEAGYFVATKGEERVLIVRVGNAKIPADLGSVIYAHLERPDMVAGLQGKLEKFVRERL